MKLAIFRHEQNVIPICCLTPNKLKLSISCSGDHDSLSEEKTDNNAETVILPLSNTCSFCKNDFGGAHLNKLSIYPICNNCKTNLDKNIFPLWVKLFFTGVLMLVVFSVIINLRFFTAYINIKNSFNATGDGNVIKAEAYMSKAANEVPEANEIVMLASYYKGVNLLRADKSTEALSEFDKCKNLPEGFHINSMVLQAEMGSSYDKKDYNLFLTSSKAFLQLDTSLALSWGGVASAYACLYTQSDADTLKQQSLKYIKRAEAIDDTSSDVKEFYGRILYRLDSKQVISKNQFNKKFPNGYTSTNIK